MHDAGTKMSLDDKLKTLPSRFIDSLFPSSSVLRDDRRLVMTQPLPTRDYRENLQKSADFCVSEMPRISGQDRLLDLGKVKPVELKDDKLKPIYPEIKSISLPKPMESTTDYRSKL
jgi:hypothetical protein